MRQQNQQAKKLIGNRRHPRITYESENNCQVSQQNRRVKLTNNKNKYSKINVNIDNHSTQSRYVKENDPRKYEVHKRYSAHPRKNEPINNNPLGGWIKKAKKY